MKICFLILAHHELKRLNKMMSVLASPKSCFVVHIDAKCKEDISVIEDRKDTFVLKDRIDVEWGGLSIVDSVVLLCRTALKFKNISHFVLLSGDDYPVKDITYINDFLSTNIDKNFIDCNTLPSDNVNWLQGGMRRLKAYAVLLKVKQIATIEPRKFDISNLRQFIKVTVYNYRKMTTCLHIFFSYPERIHPKNLLPVGGELWWILNEKTLRSIMLYIDEHPEYREYHKDTQIPDELFFNTLVYNKTKNIEGIKRFIFWNNKRKSSPNWITMSQCDIVNKCIDNPNCLFVRKVKDNMLIQYINDKIHGKR